MKKFIAVFLAASFLATPAYALSYPVSGRWGQSTETKPGPIDCAGKRVIRFDDVQRFDSGGGVPAYRMIDLMQSGNSDFQITEAFNTAQIKARIEYRLRLIDSDSIELIMSPGGTLKLKRCA